MKCEYCSANLSIENAFCPNCGKPNKFYEAHRADMDNYEKKFNETKEELTKKTGIFSERAVFVTTIAILIALILVEVILVIMMDDINFEIIRNRDKRNATAIAAKLGSLEESGDILGFNECYDGIYDIMADPVREYDAISDAADSYDNIIYVASKLALKDYQYDTPNDLARRANNAMSGVYGFYEDAEERPEDTRYSQKHMAFCKEIEKQDIALISAYCDIPMETLKEFGNMTETERFNILNDAIEKVMEDGEY